MQTEVELLDLRSRTPQALLELPKNDTLAVPTQAGMSPVSLQWCEMLKLVSLFQSLSFSTGSPGGAFFSSLSSHRY